MMYFLILDVADNRINLASGIGKCSITFLPGKRTSAITLFSYPLGTSCFYILNQPGDRLMWP